MIWLNVEGEATACTYQADKAHGRQDPRIAHGLPVGGDLEYADEVTGKILEGRGRFDTDMINIE